MANYGRKIAPSDSKPKKSGKRILYFDLLTIVSCFAVVSLHCNGYVHTYHGDFAWSRSLLFEVVFFFAVPVFFMMTGANNMGYRRKYTTKVFLKRRMKKLLIPFIAWSLFVYLYRNWQNGTPLDFLQAFMGNEIVPIYWFFFSIISLTIAMPILSLLADKQEGVKYLIWASLLFISIIPAVCDLLSIPWSLSFTIPVATYTVMYAMLGYYLANNSLDRRLRYLIYGGAIFSLILRYAFTWFSSTGMGEIDRTLFSYSYFTAVLPAVAMFLMFKNINWEGGFFERHVKTVTAISGCAFGVYLIHILILQDFVFAILGWSAASWRVSVLCPILIFLVSLVIIKVMQKIPVLKELVP